MGLMCRMVGHRRSHGLLWRRGGEWHGVCQRCGSEVVRTPQGAWLSTEGAAEPVQARTLVHPA